MALLIQVGESQQPPAETEFKDKPTSVQLTKLVGAANHRRRLILRSEQCDNQLSKRCCGARPELTCQLAIINTRASDDMATVFRNVTANSLLIYPSSVMVVFNQYHGSLQR